MWLDARSPMGDRVVRPPTLGRPNAHRVAAAVLPPSRRHHQGGVPKGDPAPSDLGIRAGPLRHRPARGLPVGRRPGMDAIEKDRLWPMFHVKRYAGRITTRRLGSSPRLSVRAPSIAATASWTIFRSAGLIGWSSWSW